MSMPLSEWDERVRPLLWQIEDFSKLISEKARALPERPTFVTKAEVEINEAIKTLEHALKHLREAERTYQSKPVE